MARRIQAELLDSLPPDHPDALHNRRDLRITNGIMGNHRWFLRTLPPLVRPGERILEIGAGTGELSRRLIDRGLHVDGLDRWPAPETWSHDAQWHQCDVREFDGFDAYAVVIGNLIFHQFTDDELAQLGQRIRKTTRLLLACEPARRRSSQFLYRTLGPLLGVNHVSLHDAHVSIAAGFKHHELTDALGFDASTWLVYHKRTFCGAYRTIAIRRG